MVSSEFDNTIATLVLLSLFFLYIFLTRLNGWLFICTGPEIIRSGYKKVWFRAPDPSVCYDFDLLRPWTKAKGEPLRIRTPDNLLTIVSSSKLIKDLENAPNDCLSLAAASKEVRGVSKMSQNWYPNLEIYSFFNPNIPCTALIGLMRGALMASDLYGSCAVSSCLIYRCCCQIWKLPYR